ncbi:hypothetical protein [Xylophilus sp. Leaf220]|uniref:hypothetical protein n=1 Tax=Xylophilus sp. Leaf220 TaxID=1735686 RepID=UPI0012E300AE|nr:hypothetical protein [Xylophilus sp. Leaf220]
MRDTTTARAPWPFSRSEPAMPRFTSMPSGVGLQGLVEHAPDRFSAAAELLADVPASVASLQAFEADPWDSGWHAAEQLARARAAAWLGVLAEALARQGVDVAAADEGAFLQVLQSAAPRVGAHG